MIILPAIDIKDGNCVRLFKGDYATVEKVCDTPYKAAEQFKAAGAQYMHMVDLDGAKDATLANADLIIDVAKQSGLKVEVGGGIRDMAAIERYLNNGIDKVILGSAAVKNPDFVKVAEAYGLQAKRAEKLEDLHDVNDYDIVDVAVRFEDIPLPK